MFGRKTSFSRARWKKFHLEQLRALDNGIPIRAVITDYPYRGVDVEEDLNVIIKMNKHEKS